MKTTNETNCQTQLRETVLRIAAEIENGIEITSENIDEYNDDGQYDLGDTVSAYDYLKNCLDIEYREYRADTKKQYLSASILLTFGGPNIWIDTKKQVVCGAWWGDYFEASYHNDAIGLDDCCQEFWECT